MRLSGGPAQGAGQLSPDPPQGEAPSAGATGSSARWPSWAGSASADAAKAMAEDLNGPGRARRAPSTSDADYFVEEVRQRGLATLGQRLNEGGYYMRTTLDPALQTAARVALMDGPGDATTAATAGAAAWGHVEALARRLGEAGAEAGRCRPSAATGAAAIVTVGRGRRPRWPRAKARAPSSARTSAWANAGKGLKVGDLIFVEKPDGAAAIACARFPIVNGALVAMEPYTGRVLALVGGYSFSPVELQPRHPGDAPAGLGLQADRLRHGPGERLHPGQRGHRRRHHLQGRRRRGAGAPRTTTRSSTAPCRCAGAWSCRSTP